MKFDIIDKKACVFSLRSNGRLNKPTKFKILKEYENQAFCLEDDGTKDSDDLFKVGDDDIQIQKVPFPKGSRPS